MDDAIGALRAGLQRAQATVDAAAARIAADGTTTAPSVPDPIASVPAAVLTGVDVAQQLTTLVAAADLHAVTTAAWRAAMATYRSSLEMLA